MKSDETRLIRFALEHLLVRETDLQHEGCAFCPRWRKVKPTKPMKGVIHTDKELRRREQEIAHNRMLAGPEQPEHDTFMYRERGET